MLKFQSLISAAALAVIPLASAPAVAADAPLSVGVTVVDMGNQFFVAVAGGIEAAVKKLGGPDAKTIVVSGDYDLAKQSTQFDNFIQAGVNLIIVSAVDSKAIGAAVRRAEAAGIPVVAVDNTADGAQATVTTDNVTAGKQACQYIADKLNGAGNVLIINGPQVSGVIDRVDGCKQVFSNYPDIKILSDDQNGIGTRDGGLKVATALLIAHPDVNAIFAINDPSAIGADLAAKQLQRSGIIITSVDGAPDIVEALKGDTMIEASSAQLPAALAETAVQAGIDLANGKKPEQDLILVKPALVTRDNVDDYKGWDAK